MPDEQPPTPEPESTAARRKPPQTTLPATLPVLPAAPDTPLPGDLFLSLRLHGTEEQLIDLIERLSRDLPVVLCVDAYVILPDAVWDAFPPDFLSRSERILVREDLRLSTTAEIARTLHISRKTIHSYRTHIRKQFTGVAEAVRPAWMQAWLRRYPGVPAKGAHR